jgi:2-hydroxy-4-carboxymuconate semialdehyde hemiacetal dehydrogenase
MSLNVALAGPGAFGRKHLDALGAIDGVEVVSLVGDKLEQTREVADQHGIQHATTSLDDALERSDVDAMILVTPTQVHSSQAIRCMDAGKHVLVEIPLCDNLSDGRAVLEKQRATGLTCMVGHVRRFNPSHQWIHRRVLDAEFEIQHLDVQTFFFRRTNTNALGEPRDWSDHLLWHHAAHTVDLFTYQTRSTVIKANILQGPIHPDLGIAMDMSIQLAVESGALCTLSLSFNNDGPLGTFFRYIGDTGTYVARYDDLVTGNDEPIDLSGVAESMNGIELIDREFVTAIEEGREPNASVSQVLPCYETLDLLDRKLSLQTDTSDPTRGKPARR